MQHQRRPLVPLGTLAAGLRVAYRPRHQGLGSDVDLPGIATGLGECDQSLSSLPYRLYLPAMIFGSILEERCAWTIS